MSAPIGILGGGISGIVLASELGPGCEILEKSPRIGGLCASVRDQGFTFDAAGPHIMFSKNKDVLGHMVAALGDNVHQRRRNNKIWFKGRLVKYPFENGLSDLSKEDCFECIHQYLQNDWVGAPTNLEEWSYATFGRGISEKYFLPYNRKIWNHDPAKISLAWVERIPKPPLEDVLKSAIGIETEGYLHQLHFHFPKEGGYEALVEAYAARVRGNLRTNCPVQGLRRVGEAWVVETPEGPQRYDRIISTLPIHELAKVWSGFPEAGREALAKLRYNSLINVLLGVRIKERHPWTALYVPDLAIASHRISFMCNFSEGAAPEGYEAVMAEITTNPGDGIHELDDKAVIARVIADLERMGLLDPAEVTYRRAMRFEYGYPVYDLDYFEQVAQLRRAVEEAGITLLGRFAQFDYINSDVCVERALRLAGELKHAR
ncbi:MAG TPA: FAD-dependent oxidoreductase [Holophagaceae bacterium]|nr:FAD-dependent oxidoreductase [Holophagaceae bacterium]